MTSVPAEPIYTPRPPILVVDDDPYVLAAVTRTLAQEFDVTAVIGSLKGLAAVQEAATPFHVVLSDMRMPELSGIGLLQCVRQAAPRTVRILLTGYADVTTAIAAVNAAEVYRFLTKPCKPDQLIAAVRAACERYAMDPARDDQVGASAA